MFINSKFIFVIGNKRKKNNRLPNYNLLFLLSFKNYSDYILLLIKADQKIKIKF